MVWNSNNFIVFGYIGTITKIMKFKTKKMSWRNRLKGNSFAFVWRVPEYTVDSSFKRGLSRLNEEGGIFNLVC